MTVSELVTTFNNKLVKKLKKHYLCANCCCYLVLLCIAFLATLNFYSAVKLQLTFQN